MRTGSVDVLLRTGTADDARRIHRLIARHAREGRLLPRALDDIAACAPQFTVATSRARLIACAELKPLSPSVAEVRSLVVSGRYRGLGLGRRLVNELRRRARVQGFDQLCAFAHAPDYFERLGFTAGQHAMVPEKIEADCRQCVEFGRCGQHAMLMELVPLTDARPLTIAQRAV